MKSRSARLDYPIFKLSPTNHCLLITIYYPLTPPLACCKILTVNATRRAFFGVTAWTAGISALHGYLNVDWTEFRNSLRSRDKLQTLLVAGLPVTCNLTLPVACEARNLDTTSTRANFQYRRYNGWPEIKEALISGQVNAAYMLAPLVMDLAAKDVPVKIVSLGLQVGRGHHGAC